MFKGSTNNAPNEECSRKKKKQTSNCISKWRKARHFGLKASHHVSSLTILLFLGAANFVFIFMVYLIYTDTFHPAASVSHWVTVCSQTVGTPNLEQTFLSTASPKKEACTLFLKHRPLVMLRPQNTGFTSAAPTPCDHFFTVTQECRTRVLDNNDQLLDNDDSSKTHNIFGLGYSKYHQNQASSVLNAKHPCPKVLPRTQNRRHHQH